MLRNQHVSTSFEEPAFCPDLSHVVIAATGPKNKFEELAAAKSDVTRLQAEAADRGSPHEDLWLQRVAAATLFQFLDAISEGAPATSYSALLRQADMRACKNYCGISNTKTDWGKAGAQAALWCSEREVSLFPSQRSYAVDQVLTAISVTNPQFVQDALKLKEDCIWFACVRSSTFEVVGTFPGVWLYFAALGYIDSNWSWKLLFDSLPSTLTNQKLHSCRAFLALLDHHSLQNREGSGWVARANPKRSWWPPRRTSSA